MVAQQKMKEEEVDKPTDLNGMTGTDGKQPGQQSPKSRLAMLKRSSAKKAANASSDPFRFQGTGVAYKGKLIGTRDVDSARGDAMCADAMRDAKAAVKAAGTHKQRISLNINIEGIKIVDEKSQGVLFNFPVSRISFIARDTTDARAFGFVFGDSVGKYKFYGIKTAQTSDQAVLAIRDMFQIVYEMKRKQIEQVKQKQEEEKKKEMEENGIRSENGVLVADLLDLETELQHIEQGVNQLAHIPVVAGDEWPGEHQQQTMHTPKGLDPFGQQPFSAAATTGNSPSAGWDSSFGGQHHAHQQHQQAFSTPLSQSPVAIFGVQPAQIQSQNPMAMWSAQRSQPQLHSSFNSTPNFSETNPFAAALQQPPIFATPSAAVVDPFDTSAARLTLGAQQQLPGHGAPTSQVSWGLGNENTAPSMDSAGRAPVVTTAPLFASSAPLTHTHSFTANFNDTSSQHVAAEAAISRKVSSLEEAFSKLVDMDALVAQPTTKKNPFEHLINPPKVPLNAVSSPPVPARPAPGPYHQARPPHPVSMPMPVFPGKTSDPFADDFFN